MFTIGLDASRANKKEKTGTEWYSYYLIQELKKIIPAQIRVILYSKEPLTNGLEKLPAHWQSRVLHWPPRLLWTQIRLSLAMLNPLTRPDLLFIPAHTIPLCHPRKTILVAHDIGFEKMAKLYSGRELDYHRWAMRYAVKKAQQIITVSHFSQKEIIDFYHLPEKKIAVVHNGFAKNNYYPLTPSAKDQTILNKYRLQRPYLLFIGRLEEKKNIPTLIEAFAEFKKKVKIPYQLVLVGQPGYGYLKIEAKIYKLGLKDSVIEPGYLPPEDINLIMNQAELFVFPSLYEGFGIPVLEAFSAGTPVVCSQIPPLQEVGGEACQYFDPQDKKAMADTIFSVLNNQPLKEKMRATGTARLAHFSWSKCAAETWKVIAKFI